jgi:putative membrane protein
MSRRVLRRTSYVALCAAALVSGCGTKDSNRDSTKMADSANGSVAPAGASASSSASTPASTAPTMTDANILAMLDADNIADSSAGSIAASKGTNASVKEFGRMMMKDHHQLRVEGAALAKKDSLTPAMPAGNTDEASEKALADSLNSMAKGADWDKFYIDHMVTGHEKVLREAQDAANNAQNADLKAMIQKATPVVQKHLDKAKDIQTKLGTAKS